MSISCIHESSCGKRSSHCQPRAAKCRGGNHASSNRQISNRQASQREAATAALDRRVQWRGGAAARSGAFRKSGPGEQSPESAGGRGQACAHRPGGLCQGSARTDFWHSNGTPALGRVGRRNLRSAGHSLAVGGSAAPLQRSAHHSGALAHHVRHRQTAHQPPSADRQAGGEL